MEPDEIPAIRGHFIPYPAPCIILLLGN